MMATRAIESKTSMGLVGVTVAVLTLAVVMFPTPAQAAVDCAAPSALADSDNDGFSDLAECTGITLPAALGGGFFPRCTSGVDRATCVDPDSKDVFVIVVAASNSLLPSNPLQLLSGLPVAVHIINGNSLPAVPTDRTVIASQRAILLSESNDTNGDTVGQCNSGTPNDAALCLVFTQRIVNFVNSTYATCTGAIPATAQSIITTYIQQVAAHEPSHSMKLTKIYDSRFGGHHYKQGAAAMMAQANSYSCKGGTLTWAIGTPYTDADKGDFLLK